MSTPRIAPADYYAPNQQVVHSDEAGPAEEGDGGTAPVDGTGGTDPNEPNPKAVEPAPEPEPPAPEPEPEPTPTK
jgi:hypothetical protein